MNYRGNFLVGSSIYVYFNTHKLDGTPVTLAGTPGAAVYKVGTTESVAGVTLTVDFDGKTGFHQVVIDTTADATFYAAAADFTVVLAAGTVDGTSIAASIVGSFSLENRAEDATGIDVVAALALLAAIKGKTDLIPATPAAVGSAMTLEGGERDAIAAALLDLVDGIEAGRTPRQALRLMLASLANKCDGAPLGPIHFRDTADGKNRISATVDADGNRTAVVHDVS